LSISSCCVSTSFQWPSWSVNIVWSSTVGSRNECLSYMSTIYIWTISLGLIGCSSRDRLSLIGCSSWDWLSLISLISGSSWNSICLIGLIGCWWYSLYSLIICLINLISCCSSIGLDEFSLSSYISLSFRIVNNLSLNW
jgi:hypothetical protein